MEPELPISSQAEDVSHVKDEEYDRIFSRLAELEKEEEEAEHANQEEIGSDDSDVSPGHVILEEEMKSLEVSCMLLNLNRKFDSWNTQFMLL